VPCLLQEISPFFPKNSKFIQIHPREKPSAALVTGLFLQKGGRAATDIRNFPKPEKKVFYRATSASQFRLFL
jgi:hypothetical protein